MSQTIITAGQSLLDVALQTCGSLAALFDLADGAGLAITDLPTPGATLPVPDSAAAQAEVVSYFANRQQRINTDADGTCFPPFPNYLPDFLTGDWQAADFLATP